MIDFLVWIYLFFCFRKWGGITQWIGFGLLIVAVRHWMHLYQIPWSFVF